MSIIKRRRTNQEWLDELCGDKGVDAQQEAHLDLADYLYVVAQNYLRYRQNDTTVLRTLDEDEVRELARDCGQDLLEKFAANDFVNLAKFRGEGRFTSWAAQCLRNDMAGLLRRAPFTQEHVDLRAAIDLSSNDVEHDRLVVRVEVVEALEECLNRLQEHYRIALERCIGRGESSKIVAQDLGKSETAINLIVMRAKEKVRNCLIAKGFGPDILDFLS